MLATAYVRPGRATLVAIASWSGAAQNVTLTIDWAAIGLDAGAAQLTAPLLPSFNRARHEVRFAHPSGPVAVPAYEGWLLLLQPSSGQPH